MSALAIAIGSWIGWLRYHWLAVLLAVIAAILLSRFFKTDKRGDRNDKIFPISILVLCLPLIYVGMEDMYNSVLSSLVDDPQINEPGSVALRYVYPWGLAVPGLIALTLATVAWLARSTKIFYLLVIASVLTLSVYFAYHDIILNKLTAESSPTSAVSEPTALLPVSCRSRPYSFQQKGADGKTRLVHKLLYSCVYPDGTKRNSSTLPEGAQVEPEA